jgi:hypothetical protein
MPKLAQAAILLLAVTLLFLLVIPAGIYALWPDQAPDWTGFGPYNEEAEGPRAKTLWDWFDLLIGGLIVGGFLAGVGYFVNRSAREQEQKIARDNRNQATLQDYFDKMAELLLERHKLRQSEDGAEVRSIARAITLATLRGLDGERKGSLLKFLYESRLIGYSDKERERHKHIISLNGADLSWANLSETGMMGANLHGAVLIETSLFNTDLSETDMLGADMTRAELNLANLSGADLGGANLGMADLYGTNLIGAYLEGTTLIGASNLTEALLIGARYTKGHTYYPDTEWPDGFDPQEAGAILVEEPADE